MTRLDGTRTLEELGEEYALHFGRRLADTHWEQLLRLLWAKGLLAGAPEPSPVPEAPRRSLLSGSYPLVPDATALTDRVLRAIGFALRPWIVLPALLLVVVMEAVIATHLGDYLRESSPLRHQPSALVAVGCALWASSALHELAHGVTARRFGARVGGMGLRWRLPVVIMYCAVEDLPYLRSRRHQTATAAAGTAMNLFFLLPFWALSAVLPPGNSARPAAAGLLLSGSVLALVNLVPLPPLDGYRIVGQALRVHRLASGSSRYLMLRAAQAIGRDNSAQARHYPRRARIAYTAYGLGAVLFLGCTVAAVAAICHHAFAPRYGLWAAVLPGTAAVVLPLLGTLPGGWRRRRSSAQTTPRSPSTKRVEGR